MGEFKKFVEIRAPSEKVWEMLALDRMPEWKENCKSVMFTSNLQTSKDKYKVGATARFVDKHSNLMMTVADSFENERITYRTSYSFVHRLDLTYVLEPLDLGTKLTCLVSYGDISLGVVGKAVFKLMLMASGDETQRSLENLKSVLEK